MDAPPDGAWTLSLCPDGETRSLNPGDEGVWTLVARCADSGPPPLEAAPLVEIESPPLDAHANWYLRFKLQRFDPEHVLRVSLVDAADAAIHSVLLDPGACRWLDAPARSGGSWTETRAREWMDASWWLDEEHLFELRYHASPQSVSVRFDWNYMAFVYAPAAIAADTFTFRISVDTPDEPDGGFELWEFTLEEREDLPRW
jgi:hypothetical protein